MITTPELPHMFDVPGCPDMRTYYDRCGLLATSETADIALIRAHIAYWSGRKHCDRLEVRPSRGHSYRVSHTFANSPRDVIVKIIDHYDHREGVTGWTD